MKLGKAFEIFVKRLLINVGFSEVKSDGWYVFDGAPGQMIQGLGEVHNADVLLEPPVQTPFFSPTRLLIECKDYKKKIGLNTIRSALGLREDINHFELVDVKELSARRSQKRKGIIYNYTRFSYQVAVATLEGFTIPAQKFALTHRIPLIEFNKMTFGPSVINQFQSIVEKSDNVKDEEIVWEINRLADDVGNRLAVAITNSGQMLFLYRIAGKSNEFSDEYSLHWCNENEPWLLKTGESKYIFQLPDCIMKQWLNNVTNELEMKREAIYCKEGLLSNMIVYYTENYRPIIKMISINRGKLEEAKQRLQ